jgi:hypothetical protein
MTAGSAAGTATTEGVGPGDICVVEAGTGCRDSTGCWAAALTEASSAAVNIHFQVRMTLSLQVSFKYVCFEVPKSSEHRNS